jgi:hypothetical protein
MSVAVPKQQKTNWLFILGTTGGALVLGFLFLKGFWFPWQQANRALLQKEEEYDRRHHDYAVFMKERKRLDTARLLGLPRNLEKGGTDYAGYLQNLLRQCGLTVEDFQGPNGLDARSQTPARGGKVKPGHITLSYLVRATGDWAALTKLLEKFQRTPLLHRIKSWRIERPTAAKGSDSRKLGIALTVEALVVGRNDRRSDDLWGIDSRLAAMDSLLALRRMPAGWAMLLRGQALLPPPMPARRYADLARVNPFVGGPTPWDRPPPVKSPGKIPGDERPNVYLVFIDIAGQRAILLNETKPDRAVAMHIDLAAPGRRDGFEVWNGKEKIKGKVLRVEPRDIYFQVGRDIYLMHVGDNLAEAMRRPLAPGELRNRGLRAQAGL